MRWLAISALVLLGPMAKAQDVELATVWQTGSFFYKGMGDIVPGWTSYYGFWGYTAAQVVAGTQPLIRLETTAAGNEQCDVLVSSGSGTLGLTSNCTGSSSGQTLIAFCPVTCKIKTFYDLVGSNNLTQSSLANMPTLTSNCLGGTYCASFTGSGNRLASSSSYTPSSGTVSFVFAAQRSAASTGAGPTFLGENGANNLVTAVSGTPMGGPVPNTWRMAGGTSGAISNGNATEAVWHVGQAIMNGALSGLKIDNGLTLSGTVTGNTAAGVTQIIGSSGVATYWSEGGFIDGTALTGAQVTSACQAIQAHSGASNFGAVC